MLYKYINNIEPKLMLLSIFWNFDDEEISSALKRQINGTVSKGRKAIALKVPFLVSLSILVNQPFTGHFCSLKKYISNQYQFH
ncbi:hypothetical protein D7Z94_22400 [Ulvibacterium marinum]|uniref:Uncharacterized protein n=1 Tax=Ulvibacterium marinum TaxID=2419782 RepID=A0A3B0BZU2_9FLAO|nr:hypothetical protein D7Z94_22400 [Ulvibacterium marinum]